MIGDSFPPVLRFRLFEGIPHGFSTRHGGVSGGPFASLNLGYSTADSEENVRSNRRAFLNAVGVRQESVAVASLTHGSRIEVLSEGQRRHDRVRVRPVREDSLHREQYFRSDGVVSDISGLSVLMTFADCVPVLVADRLRGIIGAAHAGWRGTATGIAGNLVRTLREEFRSDPADLVAAIGPSIGPCCYTVGDDVVEAFRANGKHAAYSSNGSLNLDLWATNERQLIEAGVHRDAIENHRLCTSCRCDTFFSHRAEKGLTGRLALCIGLP